MSGRPAAVGAVAAGLVAGRAARRFPVRAVVHGGLATVGLALATLTVLGRSTGCPFLGTVHLVVGGVGGLGDGVRPGRRPRRRPAGLDRDGRLPRLRRPARNPG
ncbi:hypothetical protein QFZ74_001103 [Streptomyces sp. V3I7]|nr:hypothetical protein [Streptomyces sp. V3I7]